MWEKNLKIQMQILLLHQLEILKHFELKSLHGK